MKVLSPKVSVIIPVYNVEKYLHECLDSIVNQTVREIEIICIDDGSTDNSGAILDEYATRDERFVVIHQENAGQSVARNRGLDIAHGEFIAFLDSDDYVDLDLLEKVLPCFEDTEVDIVQFLFQIFGNNTWKSYDKKWENMAQFSSVTGMWQKLYCTESLFFSLWTQIFRRELIETHALRFLEGCLWEDNHFSSKGSYYCRKRAMVPERLYHYRQGSGYTSDLRRNASLRRYPEMYERLLEDFQRCNLPDELIEYFQSKYYASLRKLYLRWTPSENRHACKEAIMHKLSDADWEQIFHKNRFVTPKVRYFFYQLYGESFRAYWEFVCALWKKPYTVKKMIQLEKKRRSVQ